MNAKTVTTPLYADPAPLHYPQPTQGQWSTQLDDGETSVRILGEPVTLAEFNTGDLMQDRANATMAAQAKAMHDLLGDVLGAIGADHPLRSRILAVREAATYVTTDPGVQANEWALLAMARAAA